MTTLVLVHATAACGGGGPRQVIIVDPPPNGQAILEYMPFVEAVHFPAQVQAGKQFEVDFDISADAKPESLHGPEFDHPRTMGIGTSPYLFESLWRSAANINLNLPAVHTMHVVFPSPSPGVITVSYFTADVRQDGGVPWMVDTGVPASGLPSTILTKSFQITATSAQQPAAVRIPYIEAIHIPSPIYVGQEFDLSVDISASASPDCLRCTEHPFPDSDVCWSLPFPEDVYAGHVELQVLRPADGDLSLPAIHTVHYHLTVTEPGKYLVDVISTKAQSDGGLPGRLDFYDLQWAPLDGSQFVDEGVNFTALPAPAA